MLTVIRRDPTVTLTVVDGTLVSPGSLPIFYRVATKSGRNTYIYLFNSLYYLIFFKTKNYY